MSLANEELRILKDVVSLPTAPFCETAVQDYIRTWAKQNRIRFKPDQHGNIVLEYPGRGRQKGSPWVLQAHMDHPGFVFIKRRGKMAQAWFRGGVRKDYFQGSRMCFIPAGGHPVHGTVLSVRKDSESGFLRCRIELERPSDIPEGTLGMWDLPPWRKSGDRLNVRVADDLCGVASILLTLARLKQSGSSRKVYGLLTRAEEVGFIGAISAAQAGTIDPAWPVLGIEASSAQPSAPLGQGAVVRVGDRSSIFDPELTAQLRLTVRELQTGKKTAHLKYSESLMPGGSTESTGLAVMGYKTCAVCLPLGNYHNMGRGKIAPEQICVSDFEALVALLSAVVLRDPNALPTNGLKKRLLENHAQLKVFLPAPNGC
jgi:putative aminopeptidase FrvX